MSKIPQTKALTEAMQLTKRVQHAEQVADVATQYATTLKSELFGAATVTALLIERFGERDERGRAFVEIPQKDFDELIDGALQLGVKQLPDGFRFTAIFPPKAPPALVDVVPNKDGDVTLG